MMGEQLGRQDRLFYEFCLEDLVPAGHLLRRIDAVLDLSWLRTELSPYYSHTGCPSVDPELLIRMLIVGYCYSIRAKICHRSVSARQWSAPAGGGSARPGRRSPACSPLGMAIRFAAAVNMCRMKPMKLWMPWG
jgi:hypothetical protein